MACKAEGLRHQPHECTEGAYASVEFKYTYIIVHYKIDNIHYSKEAVAIK